MAPDQVTESTPTNPAAPIGKAEAMEMRDVIAYMYRVADLAQAAGL